MKKMMLLFLLIVISFSLSGCYKHYQDMELVDIKVYQLDGEEIVGTYENYYDWVYDFENNSLTYKRKLNSAAPVVNYYCVKIMENTSVKVVFKFKPRLKKYEMAALSLYVQDDFDNVITITEGIENVDGYFYVTNTFNNINKDKNLYATLNWQDAAGNKHSFSTRASNTYIYGCYFIIDEPSIDI